MTAGVDQHELRVQDAGVHRPGHRFGQVASGQGAVGEQDLDQRPGAGRVAELAAGSSPVLLVGRGTGEGSGLDLENLQLAVHDQELAIPAGRALVPCRAAAW